MYCEIYNKARRKMYDTSTKDRMVANGNILLLGYYLLYEVL